jgi:hypothetical protein
MTKSVNFSAKKRQLNESGDPCGITGLISIDGTPRRLYFQPIEII